MQIRLTVTFDQEHGGQEFKITCSPRDQLAWEKAGTDRAAGRIMTLAYKLDDLYSLAFATLRRQGLWDGAERELREWADVEIGHASDDSGEDRSDEDPTQRGHSTDEPSNSG